MIIPIEVDDEDEDTLDIEPPQLDEEIPISELIEVEVDIVTEEVYIEEATET